MHYSSHDRYKRLDPVPTAPRRSFVSRYRYYILAVVAVVITVAVAVPVVLLRGPGKSSTSAGFNAPPRDLSIWKDSFDINTDWDRVETLVAIVA